MTNDRFKFRVWDVDNKEYHSMDDVINNDGELGCAAWTVGFIKYRDGLHIVEQCTGLKDKNGKLIYEGDILFVQALDWHKKERWDCETIRTYWSVEYKNYWNHCGFMVFGINRRFHKPLTRTVIFNSEAEVIGNIHQNPELLKESK